jgi:hypothetical protein
MKRSTRDFECEPPLPPQQKHTAEAQNASALLNYFDSMAMASEADQVELALRYVVDIERLPLFRALAGLIVDAYFQQRTVRLRNTRLCYKRRHQEATLLSYKERIIEALRTGVEEDVSLAADTDSEGSSSGGSNSSGDDVHDMHNCKPDAIGTRLLSGNWRLCDAADRRCIGRLRLFASWWFTNFAVVLLAIRYRGELVTHALSIENRVRSVCRLGTLVPWCIDLAAELEVEDAAHEAPRDPEARAAAAYASCRYLCDGVLSAQATRLVGFICINSMHGADACLPPTSAASLSSSSSSLDPQCGVFRHPGAAAAHYNLERAVRLGNLAMHFFVEKKRPTVPALCTDGSTIVQAALDWLREQQKRQRDGGGGGDLTSDGRFVKGFLDRLIEALDPIGCGQMKTD